MARPWDMARPETWVGTYAPKQMYTVPEKFQGTEFDPRADMTLEVYTPNTPQVVKETNIKSILPLVVVLGILILS